MEINTIDKIPFDFVQCSSARIKQLKKNSEIEAGTLYFVLDTKQILLGKGPETTISMGKSTGVRFATKKIDATRINKDVNFLLKELEDQSCYPQVDDLIFNSDGCFYRVVEIDEPNIKTLRLTVAGSGKGGGSSSPSAGPTTSADIDIFIPPLNLEGMPPYIIEGISPNFSIEIPRVELTVNGAPSKPVVPTVTQIIRIGDSNNYVDYTSKIIPWKSITVNFDSSWFSTLNSSNNITLLYGYSTQWYEYPLGSVSVVDLSIDDTDFRNTYQSVASLGSFSFEAKINRIETAEHRIYFSLKDSSGKEMGKECHPSGIAEDKDYGYYFIPSGNKFTVPFSSLPYGIYSFEVKHAVLIDEELVWGNSYAYKIMSTYNPSADSRPLLLVDTSKIDGKTFQSTESIIIPVLLYDNSNSSSSEGIVYITYPEELNREPQPEKVTYGKYTPLRITKPTPGENYTVTVQYENAENVTFTITVTDLGKITTLPVVELSADGRTNTQDPEVRKTWSNTTLNNVSLPANVTLENFTWTDNGTGWTGKALHFAGDAKATVNFNPYQMTSDNSSIPTYGMSILLDFNVQNFTKRSDSEIIKCFDDSLDFGFKIYGDRIEFKGGAAVQDAVSLAFMETEKIHLAIVFSKKNTNDTENNDTGSLRGLIEFYLNGVLVAARLYSADQFPSVFEDTSFTIGNSNSIIDLYSINIFNTGLTSSEVLKEYLITLSGEEGTKEQIRNEIYDLNGNIDIQKIKDNAKLPVMIITGELPTIKADKTKKVRIQFSHPDFPDRDFDTEDEKDYGKSGLVNIEVQGTSSQFYPVKNWKIKNLTKYGEKYELAEGQIPTSTFCLKADYAESTGSHNTQNANLIETFYSATSYKPNPAQIKDERCRTTIYGYPIVVFHRYTDNSGKVRTDFLGKYNFNFDKGSKEVFGFKGANAESWEFKDNDDISGMSLNGFQTAVTGELYAWDKWKMTFYSTAEAGTTRTAYFPLDDSKTKNMPEEFKSLLKAPSHRGFEYKLEERHPDCNSNYDYVKSLIQPYIDYMTQYGKDESERIWWASAKCDEPRIVPLWATYFEARYCEKPQYDMYGNEIEYLTGNITDKDTSEQEMETVYDISKFAELYDWILSTGSAGDPDKEIHPTDLAGRTKGQVFQQDLGKYFDLDGLCLYYVYTHFAIMADQRAKNMFFTYWEPTPRMNGDQPAIDEKGNPIIDGGLWCPWFYDNDTSYGIDNDGFERFTYDSEDDDTDTKEVYQGEKSILWKNLKKYFNSNLSSIYKQLRANLLTKENLYKYFINDAVNKWPAAIYNEDSDRKYIQYAFKKVILSNDKTDEDAEREDVLSKLRGNGLAHFKRFVPDRLAYCDGRWGLMPTNSNGLVSIQLRPAATPKLEERKLKLYQYLEEENLLNNDFISSDELVNIISNKTFSNDEFQKYYNKYKETYPEDSEFVQTIDSIDVSLDFKPFTTGFYHLLFGADMDQLKDKFEGKFVADKIKNQSFTVTSGGNNVTYFLPPEHILDPGDLSQLAPINLLADDAVKLEVFRVGNKEKTPMLISVGENNRNELDGYTAEEVNRKRDEIRNGYPEGFNTSKTKNSLKLFDFSNIGSPSNSDTSVLNLSSYPNLREVYARNSKVGSVSFRKGGYLEKLILPDTVREFVIEKQLLLTEEETSFENIYINGKNPYRNLTKIIIENCDNFNSKEFLLKCLDNNSAIENYNVPDRYLTDSNKKTLNKTIRITGIDYEKNDDGTPKAIKEIDGEKIYSSWVFKDNNELKTFVENLEYYTRDNERGERPVTLKGQNDAGRATDKIYLQGTCYALGEVDGGLVERLKSLVEGDFEIIIDPLLTYYNIHFYYISPEDMENNRISLEKKRTAIQYNGADFVKKIYYGQNIGNPYDEYVGEFYDDSDKDYIPDKENYKGYNYIHNADYDEWMLTEKDQIPTELIKQDNALTNNPIFKTYDVYAVYTMQAQPHLVEIYNDSKLLFTGQVLHGRSYLEQVELSGGSLPSLPTELIHPSDVNKEEDDREYEFTKRWFPDPSQKIYEDTKFYAQYDYKALQTYALLEKRIAQLALSSEVRIIPEYSFYGCNKIQKLIIPNQNIVVNLSNDNVFENSSIKKNGEKGTGKIYVNKKYLYNADGTIVENGYLDPNGSWKNFTDSIVEITEQEIF